MATDAHTDTWMRNSLGHLEKCDNCTGSFEKGFLMCQHHAEEMHATVPCAGCGRRQALAEEALARQKTIKPPAILCDTCQVDPPQAYSDWCGKEAGLGLARRIRGALCGLRIDRGIEFSAEELLGALGEILERDAAVFPRSDHETILDITGGGKAWAADLMCSCGKRIRGSHTTHTVSEWHRESLKFQKVHGKPADERQRDSCTVVNLSEPFQVVFGSRPATHVGNVKLVKCGDSPLLGAIEKQGGPVKNEWVDEPLEPMDEAKLQSLIEELYEKGGKADTLLFRDCSTCGLAFVLTKDDERLCVRCRQEAAPPPTVLDAQQAGLDKDLAYFTITEAWKNDRKATAWKSGEKQLTALERLLRGGVTYLRDRPHTERWTKWNTPFGELNLITDPEIPDDVVLFLNDKGEEVGRIVNLGTGAPDPVTPPEIMRRDNPEKYPTDEDAVVKWKENQTLLAQNPVQDGSTPDVFVVKRLATSGPTVEEIACLCMDYYGSQTPFSRLANISQGAEGIVVKLFDPSSRDAAVEAIQEAGFRADDGPKPSILIVSRP